MGGGQENAASFYLSPAMAGKVGAGSRCPASSDTSWQSEVPRAEGQRGGGGLGVPLVSLLQTYAEMSAGGCAPERAFGLVFCLGHVALLCGAHR